MKTTFLLCLSLLSAACGGASIPPPSHAQSESMRDEVSRYRGALAQIKAHPNAKAAASDIDRAEEWLDTAKSISADNGSSARLRLYLDAVAAQLVMVQSQFARTAARKSAGMTDPPADGDLGGDTTESPKAAHNDSNGDDL